MEGSEIYEHSIVLGSIFTDIKEKFERELEQGIIEGVSIGAGGPENMSAGDMGMGAVGVPGTSLGGAVAVGAGVMADASQDMMMMSDSDYG